MSSGRSTRRPDRRQEKGRSVGGRAFDRRARASQARQTRKRTTSSRARRRTTWSVELKRLLGGVPRAAWLCVIVAILNAVCWSIVMPPFEAPDEPDHYAYTKQLAETGSLPTSGSDAYETSPEINTVLNELHYTFVRAQPRHRTILTPAEQRSLEQSLQTFASKPGGTGSYAAGVAASQPPLYYALEAVPFGLGSNMLTRLALMRLLSALLAGMTALFAFLFVRETLPGVPWSWTVGGLSMALAPLFGFISGALNPDALLFALSAMLFYSLARAFRRGLTTPTAALIGTTIALGLLTKLNFLGLVPGALIGLLLLTLRARRTLGRSAWRYPALACAIPAVPIAIYTIANAASNHPVFGLVSSVLNAQHVSGRELSYMWQLFLPRLPGMNNDFPGLFTTRQLWFNGYVGLLGWLDTAFPTWVYDFALIPLGAIVALFLRGLATCLGALRARLGEVLVYLLMAVGLMAIIGHVSYGAFPQTDAAFAESRYLLPLLPLFAAVLALAARGAGRRWGPAVGTLIIVLFLAHDIFSQLLVAGRYYA